MASSYSLIPVEHDPFAGGDPIDRLELQRFIHSMGDHATGGNGLTRGQQLFRQKLDALRATPTEWSSPNILPLSFESDPLSGRQTGGVRLAVPNVLLEPFQALQELGRGLESGAFDPMQSSYPGPEAIGGPARVTMDLAMQGGAGVPSNALGIFGGKWAKEAPAAAFDLADEMLASGAKPTAIWKTTGLHQGADGKWRFEIPDTGAKFDEAGFREFAQSQRDITKQRLDWFDRKDAAVKDYLREVLGDDPAKFGVTLANWITKLQGEQFSRVGDKIKTWRKANPIPEEETKTVGDFLDHPELFAQYPELKNVQLRPTSAFGVLGSHDKTSGLVQLNPGEHDLGGQSMLETLLHELQHAVQSREGFTGGGSPGKEGVEGASAFIPRLQGAYSTLKERRESFLQKAMDNGADWDQAIESWDKTYPLSAKQLDDLHRILQMKGDPAADFRAYQAIAGEVEARNVATRANDGSNALAPWMTEDYPRLVQWIPDYKSRGETK